MNMNELTTIVAEMDRNDFAKLLQIIDEKKEFFRKLEALEMQKKVGIGKFVCYKRGK